MKWHLSCGQEFTNKIYSMKKTKGSCLHEASVADKYIWTNDTFSSSANYLFRNEYLTFIHPFMNRNYQEVLVTCRKSEYRQTINIINIIHIRIWNKGMSFKPKKIYLFCLSATWWLWCRSLRLVQESLVSPPFCNNLLTRKPV